ncbi:hypothetical protein K523DRAFT_324127 [Schizophyllum commune Tattone D]|nr:hypothetical protein K523DRAFT_324127 [Schizophyllum commune Tattone D]
MNSCPGAQQCVLLTGTRPPTSSAYAYNAAYQVTHVLGPQALRRRRSQIRAYGEAAPTRRFLPTITPAALAAPPSITRTLLRLNDNAIVQ